MPTTILAIDDSPTLRKFISKHLSAAPEPFEVLTAANGEEGVQTALEKQPQLILLDFILPDFNGDKVCEKLAESELTRSIPIILMSSSAPDIEKTEKAFDAIIKSIVKPFSPQLLLSTVKGALEMKASPPKPEPSTAPQPEAESQAEPETEPSSRTSDDEPGPETPRPVVIPQQARAPQDTPDAKEAPAPIEPTSPPTPPEVITLQGNLSHFPLLTVLRAAAAATSGRLEIDLGEEPATLYFRGGLPCLITTRDPDAYLNAGEFEVDDESRAYFENLKLDQRQTGRPIFLRMAEENIIPPEQARELLQQYGDYYFAPAWAAAAADFRFYPMPDLPEFCPPEPLADNLEAWALHNLRCLSPQNESVDGTIRPGDTPQLDPHGYHLVQFLPLNEIEVGIIRQLAVAPGTVETLASQIGESIENIKAVLFRLRELEIIALWPAAE